MWRTSVYILVRKFVDGDFEQFASCLRPSLILSVLDETLNFFEEIVVDAERERVVESLLLRAFRTCSVWEVFCHG